MGEGVGAEGTPLEDEADVDTEGTPLEDEANVEIDAAPDADEVAPDDDVIDVYKVADEDEGIEVGVNIVANTDFLAKAEVLEVFDARFAPLGLCGMTFATWPSVIVRVAACPLSPTVVLRASNLLWVDTGGLGFAMASDEICLTLGARL